MYYLDRLRKGLMNVLKPKYTIYSNDYNLLFPYKNMLPSRAVEPWLDITRYCILKNNVKGIIWARYINMD